LLAEAVASFLGQDYPADRCELIVLDDAGQYAGQSRSEPKPWHLVSIRRRFMTLGEKRNACAALASPDVDAYAVWDDDDIYLPWTLSAHAAALEKAPWSRPSQILVESKTPPGLRLKETNGLFHPAWAFTRDAFRDVHGYPFMQSGQDQALAGRLKAAGVPFADPIQAGFAPYFFYRWSSSRSYHLSAMDRKQGYERLAERVKDLPFMHALEPQWNQDYIALAQSLSSSSVRSLS
jgi:hypothetical protein